MEFQFDDEECEDTGHGGLSGTEEPVPPLVDPISPCLSDSSQEDEAMEASSLPITPQPVSSIVKSICSKLDGQDEVDSSVISNSVLRNERSKKVTMPWETGFAARVFQYRDPPSWPYSFSPTVGRVDFMTERHKSANESSSSSSAAPISRPALPFALRRLRVTKVEVDPDSLRQRAITVWRIIIEDDLNASSTGIILKEQCETLASESILNKTLDDTFAVKSTATLYKRGREMLSFVQWFRQQHLNGSPLHFVEEHLYRYVDFLRLEKSAPTKASSFIQSVRFTVTLLGCVTAPMDTVISARIKGACFNMYLNKRPLKQACPLSVSEVKALEEAAINGDCVHDRVAAGFMMFCLMSSARVADAQNVTNLKLDTFENVCLLECDTLRHKTATTSEKKTTFLPYIALGSVFNQSSWAKSWMQARKDSGLVDSSWAMPAPNLKGGWLNRRLTTGEITLWLRDILVTNNCDVEAVERLSSHSLKTTMLSWAAKFGLDLQTRRILGHHVDPEARSALTYSRDALIDAQIKISDMLTVLGSGGFNPDLSRAERLYRHRHEQPISGETVPGDVQKPDDKSLLLVDNESSSEDDVADVQTAEREASQIWQTLTDQNSLGFQFDEKYSYLQHTISGCIHICHPDLSEVLLCGRLITCNYRSALKHDPIKWTLCGQCSSMAGTV